MLTPIFWMRELKKEEAYQFSSIPNSTPLSSPYIFSFNLYKKKKTKNQPHTETHKLYRRSNRCTLPYSTDTSTESTIEFQSITSIGPQPKTLWLELCCQAEPTSHRPSTRAETPSLSRNAQLCQH